MRGIGKQDIFPFLAALGSANRLDMPSAKIYTPPASNIVIAIVVNAGRLSLLTIRLLP